MNAEYHLLSYHDSLGAHSISKGRISRCCDGHIAGKSSCQYFCPECNAVSCLSASTVEILSFLIIDILLCLSLSIFLYCSIKLTCTATIAVAISTKVFPCRVSYSWNSLASPYPNHFPYPSPNPRSALQAINVFRQLQLTSSQRPNRTLHEVTFRHLFCAPSPNH